MSNSCFSDLSLQICQSTFGVATDHVPLFRARRQIVNLFAPGKPHEGDCSRIFEKKQKTKQNAKSENFRKFSKKRRNSFKRKELFCDKVNQT